MAAARYAAYRQAMLDHFAAYRDRHFAGRDALFEPAAPGQIVFRLEAAHRNYFDSALYHEMGHRSRSQRALGNSQVLATSVFGTLYRREDLGLLAEVRCVDGRAVLAGLEEAQDLTLELERPATSLYQGDRCRRHLWLVGPRLQLVIVARLLERDLGPCPAPSRGHCDGNYARRAGASLCWHSDHGALYWRYLPGVLGWASDCEHRPCPLRRPYGLVRALLALTSDSTVSPHGGGGSLPSPYEGEGQGEGGTARRTLPSTPAGSKSRTSERSPSRGSAPYPTLSPRGEGDALPSPYEGEGQGEGENPHRQRHQQGQQGLLLVYDARNPAFAAGSRTDRLLADLEACLHPPFTLRRTTWQAIAVAMARSPWYADLLGYLKEKYGIEGDG